MTTTIQQNGLTPAESFIPFFNRIAALSLRTKKLKGRLSLWQIVSGVEKFDELDEQKQLDLEELGLITTGVKKGAEEMGEILKRLFPVRSHIKASTITLEESLTSIEQQLAHSRQFAQAGDFNSALRILLDIESKYLFACEQIVERIDELLMKRIQPKESLALTSIDVVIAEVFKKVRKGRDLEQRTLETFLPPLAYKVDFGKSSGTWQTSKAILGSQGFPVPVKLMRVSTLPRAEFWELLISLSDTGKKLSYDIRLEEEIAWLLLQYQQNLMLSSSSIEFLSTQSLELVGEIIAVLTGGPAYVGALIEQTAHDSARVVASSTGLPSVIRWAIALATLRAMGFGPDSERFRTFIGSAYGTVEFLTQESPLGSVVLEICRAADAIVGAVLSTPFRALRNERLADCLPVFDFENQKQAKLIEEELVELIFSQQPATAEDGKKESKRKSAATFKALKTQEFSYIAFLAGVRGAYEKIAISTELPQGLYRTLNAYVTEALVSYSDGKQTQEVYRDLSIEELKELANKTRFELDRGYEAGWC